MRKKVSAHSFSTAEEKAMVCEEDNWLLLPKFTWPRQQGVLTQPTFISIVTCLGMGHIKLAKRECLIAILKLFLQTAQKIIGNV